MSGRRLRNAVLAGAVLLPLGCAGPGRIPSSGPPAAGTQAEAEVGAPSGPGAGARSSGEMREVLSRAGPPQGGAGPEPGAGEGTHPVPAADPLPASEEEAGSVPSLGERARLLEGLRDAASAEDLDSVRRELQQVLDGEPEDPHLRGLLGLVLLRTGNPAEAARHLESAPGPEFVVALGRSRWLRRDWDGAASAAEQALRNAAVPGVEAAAWCLLGDARLGAGQLGGAEDAYRRALAVDQGHYPALVNLGGLLTSGGRPGQGEALFAQATGLRPDAPEGWTGLALARRAGGGYDAARAALERALEAAPDFAPALKNLGILYEKYLGRPEAALPYYEAYLTVRPGDEEVERWRKTIARAGEGGS